MTTIVVLGSFWLLGAGLVAPILFNRHRNEQHNRPSRFERLRATSSYGPAHPTAKPRIAFQEFRASRGRGGSATPSP
jgi:hypothetical protein